MLSRSTALCTSFTDRSCNTTHSHPLLVAARGAGDLEDGGDPVLVRRLEGKGGQAEAHGEGAVPVRVLVLSSADDVNEPVHPCKGDEDLESDVDVGDGDLEVLDDLGDHLLRKPVRLLVLLPRRRLQVQSR